MEAHVVFVVARQCLPPRGLGGVGRGTDATETWGRPAVEYE